MARLVARQDPNMPICSPVVTVKTVVGQAVDPVWPPEFSLKAGETSRNVPESRKDSSASLRVSPEQVWDSKQTDTAWDDFPRKLRPERG